MKNHSKLVAILCLLVTGMLLANPPAWWAEEGTRIIDPNAIPSVEVNHAPVLAGQLKNVAKKAKAHLDVNLFGGAGPQVDALIESFDPANGMAFTSVELLGNHAPINLAQLKSVAKPFYERLLEAGYDTKANLIARGYPLAWPSDYPWLPTTPAAENHAPAVTGQLKMVFSFDLSEFDLAVDHDGNNLPDGWERHHFHLVGVDPSNDADGDSLTNMEEWQGGTDPTDFFNGLPAALLIVGGDGQGDLPGATLAFPLKVQIRNLLGANASNGSVAFAITSGGGSVDSANVPVSSAGIAQVMLTLPSASGAVGTTIVVQASTTNPFGSSNVSFHSTVGNLNAKPSAARKAIVTQEHGATSASIQWTDSSNNETAMYVERSTNGENWTQIATLPANSVEYTDTSVVSDEIYYYRIIAHNSVGDSSNESASSFPEEDFEPDGLTNAEEAMYATKPKVWDTDGDGVKDGDDGWALDPDFSPMRLPEARYAVLAIPLPADHFIVFLNDNSDLLIENRSLSNPGPAYIWSVGSMTYLPTSTNDYPGPIVWLALSNDRTALGRAVTGQSGNSFDNSLLCLNGQVTPLPRYYGEAPPAESSPLNWVTSYTQSKAILSKEGQVYTFNWNLSTQDAGGTGAEDYIREFANFGLLSYSGGSWSPMMYAERSYTHYQGVSLPDLYTQTPSEDLAMLGSVFCANSNGIAAGEINRCVLVHSPSNISLIGEEIDGGFLDGGVLRFFRDLPGSNTVYNPAGTYVNIGHAVTESAGDPLISGRSGSNFAIWAKKPTWKRAYAPEKEGPSSKIDFYQWGQTSSINSRLEVINIAGFKSPLFPSVQSGDLIRNGRPWNLDESTTSHTNFQAKTINEQGIIFGTHLNLNLLLVPCDIAVDANRDGVIKFAGNYNSTATNLVGKPQDKTSEDKPFRFWCNDDRDTQDNLEDGEPLTGPADSADNEIKSERDLEDFCRLHLNIGGLQDAIAAGTITVGLEWRNTSGGSPSIKVYRAAEPDGGTQYLRNDNGSGGIGNEYAAILQTGAPFKTALGTINSTPGFKFPLDFWQSTGSGITAFDVDHPNRYLIFEGVTAGKGQLVMTFWKGTTRIGEGGGCWLDIKQIKKMYQRWDSASGTGSHPWAADEFEAPSNEPKDDAIIFVHGWRMTPEGAGNFAETMFKRLWQRGFKGRFVAFHWDTWWYDAWQWLPQHDAVGAALAHYNDSELTAWQTGSTLASRVNSLPFKNKNLIAHSMGNIVVSEALRQGMSIKNYAMLNAAVPASCFDEDETRIRQAPKAGPAGITLWNVDTPDGETDSVARSVAYRGTHKNIGGNLINFYLETDTATSVGWEVNNRIAKPEPYIWGDTMHTYEFDPEEDTGHHLYKRNANDNNVQYYFDASRKYEGMAMACQSWGKVVGAWSATAGAIDDTVNLGDPALNGGQAGFDKEHSAEFNRRIQKLTPFYSKLMEKLDIIPNDP